MTYFLPLHGITAAETRANCLRAMRMYEVNNEDVFLVPTGKDTPSSPAKSAEMKNNLIGYGIPSKSILLPSDCFEYSLDANSAFGLRGQLHSQLKILTSQNQQKSISFLLREASKLIIICSWQQWLRTKFICFIHERPEVDVRIYVNREVRSIPYFFKEMIHLSQEIRIYLKERFTRKKCLHCAFCGHRSVRIPRFSRRSFDMQASTSKCADCSGSRIGVFGKSTPRVAT